MNRRMVTINGAISIDIQGQVIADTIDGAQYSGIGGHEDFIAGPALSLEDRSLLCLPSAATVGGELRSRIVPWFEAGAVITTPRHQVDVIVTEHGAAELQGLTIHQRGEALAAIAHPAIPRRAAGGGGASVRRTLADGVVSTNGGQRGVQGFAGCNRCCCRCDRPARCPHPAAGQLHRRQQVLSQRRRLLGIPRFQRRPEGTLRRRSHGLEPGRLAGAGGQELGRGDRRRSTATATAFSS